MRKESLLKGIKVIVSSHQVARSVDEVVIIVA